MHDPAWGAAGPRRDRQERKHAQPRHPHLTNLPASYIQALGTPQRVNLKRTEEHGANQVLRGEFQEPAQSRPQGGAEREEDHVGSRERSGGGLGPGDERGGGGRRSLWGGRGQALGHLQNLFLERPDRSIRRGRPGMWQGDSLTAQRWRGRGKAKQSRRSVGG